MYRLSVDSDVSAAPFRRASRSGIFCLALLTAAALTACGKSGDSAQQAQGGGTPPPPQVGVVTVAPGDVGLVTELPGRLEASRVAQVRARAAGILQKRLFTEGSDVKAGQRLFTIDDAPYRASLESAQASVAQAEANVAQTRALAERYKPLVAVNAVSRQEYDNAVASQKTAEANLAAARSTVTTARINLGYAAVTAPISGRIGRALVTEGALVGQGEATQLAVIQQIDPLYVNFTQSASDALKLKAGLASGKYKQASKGAASVSVVMEDGSVHPQTGKLLFTDLSVDPTSGQVTLRAEVPNANGLLLPGMYVRVQLEQAQIGNAILLPQQAVTRSGQGDSVMVVDKEGKVAPRPVKVGNEQNGNWVILGGLNPGEQVVVEGFQKIRHGAAVKAVPWQAASAAPAASAASAAKK